MGWSSAGEIFDPIAEMLVEPAAEVDEAVVRAVLTKLIKQLQYGDWDTEGESLERFQDNPLIVSIFADVGIKLAHTCPICGCDCDNA